MSFAAPSPLPAVSELTRETAAQPRERRLAFGEAELHRTSTGKARKKHRPNFAWDRCGGVIIYYIVMTGTYILSDYVERAMAQAEYDKLEDGTFFGKIPSCKGVVAFATTLRECENELHSTLEDWVLVGLKLGHELPVIATLNLNMRPAYEPVESV